MIVIHVAMFGNRRDFQHIGERELEFAVNGIFFKQFIQNFAGFRAVIIEEGNVLPLKAVGALAAGEHRRVEGQMTQQVERVGVRLARLRGDLSRNQSRARQAAG